MVPRGDLLISLGAVCSSHHAFCFRLRGSEARESSEQRLVCGRGTGYHLHESICETWKQHCNWHRCLHSPRLMRTMEMGLKVDICFSKWIWLSLISPAPPWMAFSIITCSDKAFWTLDQNPGFWFLGYCVFFHIGLCHTRCVEEPLRRCWLSTFCSSSVWKFSPLNISVQMRKKNMFCFLCLSGITGSPIILPFAMRGWVGQTILLESIEDHCLAQTVIQRIVQEYKMNMPYRSFVAEICIYPAV